MTDFGKINEQLEAETTIQSLGPGYYQRNTIKTEGSPVFPPVSDLFNM